MSRMMCQLPKGQHRLVDMTEKMFILDDVIESQTRRYKEVERALFGFYVRVGRGNPADAERIDELENRLSVLFEDILDLFSERETLCQDMERLREEVRDQALKVCVEKFGTFEFEIVKCDDEWMWHTQANLCESMKEKLREECRVRAMNLNEMMIMFEEKARLAWEQFDEKSEERKKWVNEFRLNLIGYAINVNRFGDLVSNVRKTKCRGMELEKELEGHFRFADRDRYIYEMYVCNGVNDDLETRTTALNNRHNDHVAERVVLYKKLSICAKQFESHQDQLDLHLGALYERRQADLSRRLCRIKDVMLNGKKKRDEVNDTIITVLSDRN